MAASAAILVPLATAGKSPQHATGDVTWNYQGTVTGHVSFNANVKTGGSLDYQDSTGGWIHGVVKEYRQIDEQTAVFTGRITDGSQGYAIPGYFYAKVVDGGTSGSQGDRIAVLANAGPESVTGSYDGPLADVTGGNLAVH